MFGLHIVEGMSWASTVNGQSWLIHFAGLGTHKSRREGKNLMVLTEIIKLCYVDFNLVILLASYLLSIFGMDCDKVSHVNIAS